jgi:PST family polysaccharide transporter
MDAEPRIIEEQSAPVTAPTVDAQSLKQKASRGGLALLARQFAVQGIALFAGVALARMLTPSIFGLFAIVNMIVSFFTFFGDFGLGAALIQQKESITPRQLNTLFTLQQAFISGCVIIIWLIAPFSLYFYKNLPPEVVWLIRAISLGLLCTSLRAAPAVELEREMRFTILSIVEFIEQFLYYVIAVILARRGFGVWSLVLGVLARGFGGMFLIYIFTHWRPRLEVNWAEARRMLKFGISFQMVQISLLINSMMLPFIVSLWCGQEGVGLAFWAYGNAYRPMMVIEHIWRISFPAISRIQDDKVLLNKALEKLIYLIGIGVFGYTALWFGLGIPIIQIIYTGKWLPAFLALKIFLIFMIISICTSLIDIFSISQGRPNIVRNIHFLRALLGWGLSLPMTYYAGIVGFAIAQLITVIVQLIIEIIYVARKHYEINWWRCLRLPLAAAVCATTIGFLLARNLPATPWALAILSVAAGLTYLMPFLIWDRPLVRQFSPMQLWKLMTASNT